MTRDADPARASPTRRGPPWQVWAAAAIVGIGLVGAALQGPPARPVAGDPAAAAPDDQVVVPFVEHAMSAGAEHARRRGRAGRPLPAVTVLVETRDGYGNDGVGPLLTLSWTEADLDRVNWRAITTHELLDLAAGRADSRDAALTFRHWCWAETASGPVLTARLCGSEGIRSPFTATAPTAPAR